MNGHLSRFSITVKLWRQYIRFNQEPNSTGTPKFIRHVGYRFDYFPIIRLSINPYPLRAYKIQKRLVFKVKRSVNSEAYTI